jgi:phage FluMu gp28-like protein
LAGITKLSRFELNAKFLSKKEKQTVRGATDWCLAVEPDLQEQVLAIRKAFGCDCDR